MITVRDLPQTAEGWHALHKAVNSLPPVEKMHCYSILARKSLYWLMRFVLSTKDWSDEEGKNPLDRPYAIKFINSVQVDHDGVLDVAARGHIKSYCKSFALPIWLLLNNAEETIGIFSFSLKLAKNLVKVIKNELEANVLLQEISWDVERGERIFYANPDKESNLWNVIDGLVVNRRGNPREASVEACGLIESMPVGKHFSYRLYDDVVNQDTVSTSDTIDKAVKALSLSQALSLPGGAATYTGTFYKYGDPNFSLLKSGARLRLNPSHEIKRLKLNEDGTIESLDLDLNKLVYLTEKEYKRLTAQMSRADEGCQMHSDPRSGTLQGFNPDDLRYYLTDPDKEAEGKNIYFLVDAANSKKKGSSFTSIIAMALGEDENLYVVDAVRDRLNLQDRQRVLFDLHRKWSPFEVRYEVYGHMVDKEAMEAAMEREGYRFPIVEVPPKGTGMGRHVGKDDRIGRLIPLFENHRIYLPKSLKKTRIDGSTYDWTQEFVSDEYLHWPSGTYKDMLDSMARIAEPHMSLVWPKSRKKRKRYGSMLKSASKHSWAVP